jgi:hypothetical protein
MKLEERHSDPRSGEKNQNKAAKKKIARRKKRVATRRKSLHNQQEAL